METWRFLGAVIILMSTVDRAWSLCQDDPVHNNRSVCEQQYNLKRHYIIGHPLTLQQADAICNVYSHYEECLTELIKDCPEDESFLDMQGYDQNTTRATFARFCADRNVYVNGTSCFNASSVAISACVNNQSVVRHTAMLEVNATRNWDAFYVDICDSQWAMYLCVMDAVQSCLETVRNLLKDIVFGLIHGRCVEPF